MDRITDLEASTISTTIPNSVFRWLLVLAITSFSAIWFADYNSGIIAQFDATAYPICVFAFIVILALSFCIPQIVNTLHFATYAVVAGYLISTSAWHHLAENSVFSNSAQWLGLNYVIAYLFLDVRKAAPTTIVVFIVTVISHYFALAQHNSLNALLGVLANIAIANIVYMLLLWTVLKMRLEGETRAIQTRTLEKHAYFDSLTQVLNRRGLQRLIDKAETIWLENKGHYSLLLIDIDHFKKVNDLYGHILGDQLLIEFSQIITAKLGHQGTLARWGGEEFVILVRDLPATEVFELAESLRQCVADHSFEHQSPMSISVGIAHSHEVKTSEDIMQMADYHLYTAKNSGRNKVMDSLKAKDLTRSEAPMLKCAGV